MKLFDNGRVSVRKSASYKTPFTVVIIDDGVPRQVGQAMDSLTNANYLAEFVANVANEVSK